MPCYTNTMHSPDNIFNKKALEESRTPGDHFDNLYDQDEDAAGQKIDEATGEQIDNSSSRDTTDEELTVVDPDTQSEDALGTIPEDADAAAQWLREHDHKS